MHSNDIFCFISVYNLSDPKEGSEYEASSRNIRENQYLLCEKRLQWLKKY